MFKGLTLDMLRVFTVVADVGSFRGAALRLNRAQSAVSQTVAACERQFGLQLFDRGGYRPALTAEGRALLGEVRLVLGRLDDLRERAAALGRKVEPILAIAVDPLVPLAMLALAVNKLSIEFPHLKLRVTTMTLGGPVKDVARGLAQVGVSATAEVPAGGLVRIPIGWVELVAVAAPTHVLAAQSKITMAAAREATQIVLHDVTALTGDADFGVTSSRDWRVSDLWLKRLLILQGHGWGGLPAWMIEDDLHAGRLVSIKPPTYGVNGSSLLECACLYRADQALGPIGQSLVDHLSSAPLSG